MVYGYIYTPARSFTNVRCCSLSAAAEVPVVPNVVCHHRCTTLHTACTGRWIVYCILCWLFLNLFKVHRRSFSHRTIKVVYRIVRSSARIDCSTWNVILNLFLVTSRILISTGVACPLLFMRSWLHWHHTCTCIYESIRQCGPNCWGTTFHYVLIQETTRDAISIVKCGGSSVMYMCTLPAIGGACTYNKQGA